MLTTAERDRLQNFIGYGYLDAPVWFLGMEEAGGGEKNLKIRAGFSPVEDLRSAQTALGYAHHFEGARTWQRQWWYMSEVMLRVNGHPAPEKEDRRLYQANRLGRLDGETLLTDLMYIPKPKIKDWDYPLSFPEFTSASEFYDSARAFRIELLSNLIKKQQPPVVVAYGKLFWDDFRAILPTANEYLDGTFNVRKSGNTLLILAHMLHTKEMRGREPEMAGIIKASLG